MKEKRLVKYFIAFFILSLFAYNWDTLSWVFNYNFINQAFESVVKTNSANEQINTVKNNIENIKDNPNYTEKENSIEIAKLNITAPLVMSVSSDDATAAEDLKKGVIHYPESAEPGMLGQVIVLGHSAPEGWPHINYEWVFSKISELKKGDEIVINYNNIKYTYIVEFSKVIDKGQETPASIDSEKSNLLLLSCWPPGKNYKRIGVQAIIKN